MKFPPVIICQIKLSRGSGSLSGTGYTHKPPPFSTGLAPGARAPQEKVIRVALRPRTPFNGPRARKSRDFFAPFLLPPLHPQIFLSRGKNDLDVILVQGLHFRFSLGDGRDVADENGIPLDSAAFFAFAQVEDLVATDVHISKERNFSLITILDGNGLPRLGMQFHHLSDELFDC